LCFKVLPHNCLDYVCSTTSVRNSVLDLKIVYIVKVIKS